MFTNRFSNLLFAAALAAVMVVVFTVGQTSAMKSLGAHANTTSSAYLVVEPTHTLRYIGGDPAYQLTNGQWVR